MTIRVFLYKFRNKIIIFGTMLLIALVLLGIGLAVQEMVLIGFGVAFFGVMAGNIFGEILQYRFEKRKLKKGY
jgi:membrane-bound ClpP family serine protease